MMIKCVNCGVLYDDNIAVCPVCHTVDIQRFAKLIDGNYIDSKYVNQTIRQKNKKLKAESASPESDDEEQKAIKQDYANFALSKVQENRCVNSSINEIIKAEELGKGSLRAALGKDTVFKIITIQKRPALAPVQIYTIVALIAVILGAVINYFVTPHVLWCPIILIAMIYGLFTILNTVESQTSTSVKIAYQIAAVSLAFYCCSLLFPYQAWYAEYCLPTIMLVGMTMQFMFMLETHNKYRPHYVSTVCVAILGYIPIIVALLQDVYRITAYVSAGVATFIILLTVIAGGRAMWTEMRGRFEY